MSDIRDEKKMPKMLTEEEVNSISGGADEGYYFACFNCQIHFDSYSAAVSHGKTYGHIAGAFPIDPVIS